MGLCLTFSCERFLGVSSWRVLTGICYRELSQVSSAACRAEGWQCWGWVPDGASRTLQVVGSPLNPPCSDRVLLGRLVERCGVRRMLGFIIGKSVNKSPKPCAESLWRWGPRNIRVTCKWGWHANTFITFTQEYFQVQALLLLASRSGCEGS